MEKQILKTTITLKFSADETQLIADVLALIAVARNSVASVEHSNTQPEPAEATEPEPEKTIPARRSNNVTRDDLCALAREMSYMDIDGAILEPLKKKLKSLGAKTVSAVKDEDVVDFYYFLQSLKDE